jgi:hypothetical protein
VNSTNVFSGTAREKYVCILQHKSLGWCEQRERWSERAKERMSERESERGEREMKREREKKGLVLYVIRW